MAWRDNPMGVFLYENRKADLKKLKADGISFVIVHAAMGPSITNPFYSQVVQDAYDNDLPILAVFTPYPAQDDITYAQNPGTQLKNAQQLTVNRKLYGYILNADRYWTGTDYEESVAGTRKTENIRKATDAAIRFTVSELADSMRKFLDAAGKTYNILIRSSDGFVQSYSPSLANEINERPFYLADWRYRTKDPVSGAVTFTSFKAVPTPVESLAVIRSEIPVNALNPLVPGNTTALKFWEFSGMRYIHPAVTDLSGKPATANFVLFNGDEESMHTLLGFTPKDTGSDDDDQGDGGTDDGDTGDGGISEAAEETLARLDAAITAFAQAWINFQK